MLHTEMFTQLSLFIVNFYLKSYIFFLHFIPYLQAPEYGSNTVCCIPVFTVACECEQYLESSKLSKQIDCSTNQRPVLQSRSRSFDAAPEPEPIFRSVGAENRRSLFKAAAAPAGTFRKARKKSLSLVICKHEVRSIYKDNMILT